jgi:hypothetical protein
MNTKYYVYAEDPDTHLKRAMKCKLINIDMVAKNTTYEIVELGTNESAFCTFDNFGSQGIYKYNCSNNDGYRRLSSCWESLIVKMYASWEIGTIIGVSITDSDPYKSDKDNNDEYFKNKGWYVDDRNIEDLNLTSIRYNYTHNEVRIRTVSGRLRKFSDTQLYQYSYLFPMLQYPRNEVRFDESLIGKHVVIAPNLDSARLQIPEHERLDKDHTSEYKPSEYCLLLDSRLERILDIRNKLNDN